MAAVCSLLQLGRRPRSAAAPDALDVPKPKLCCGRRATVPATCPGSCGLEGSAKSLSSLSALDQREDSLDAAAVVQLGIFEASAAEAKELGVSFRSKLLGRLCYSGTWVPRRERPLDHRTATFFDWDDTLFCTTHVVRNRLRKRCARRDVGIAALSESTRELLEAAVVLGPTFIVTNAESGWLEATARLFFPEIVPVLAKVTVVCARAKFSEAYPNQMQLWKERAFLEMQEQLACGCIVNLVSIGDSQYEMDAAGALARELPAAVVKTVKLRKNPTLEQLLAAHRQLLTAMPGLVAEGHSLATHLDGGS